MVATARWVHAEESVETAVSVNEQIPQLNAEDLEIIKNIDLLENWDVLQPEEGPPTDSEDEQASTGEDNDQ